jgi:uncharacterized protein YvpB
MKKKQQIRITFVILLSSMILSSFRLFPDQQSAFIVGNAPTDGDMEATVIGKDHDLSLGQIETESNEDRIEFTGGENQDALPLIGSQTPKMSARLRNSRMTKVYKYKGTEEIFGSDTMAENSNDEESPDHETTSPQSAISEDISNPEELIIRLPMEDQYHSQISETQLPNACGPTSLLMALDYFDLEESLTEVIQKLQYSPAQGGYDPYCTANPVCTSPGALVQVAQEEYGLLVDAHDGWTFQQIQESLAAGHPIIADIVWRLADEGPAHFVVIYGIDIEQQNLFYHDPYDGAEKAASWEEFSIAWDGPVDMGDPLQPQGHQFWGMSVADG